MDFIESIGMLDGPAFEATLYDDGTITIHIEDEQDAIERVLDLDEIKRIVSGLSHLVWLAENAKED